MRTIAPILLGVFAVAGCARAVPVQGVVLLPICDNRSGCGTTSAMAWNDSNPLPLYPPVLRSAGVEGEVALNFVVNVAGAVDSASIKVLSSTNTAFVRPAVHAVSKWRLAPLRVGQRTRPVTMAIRVQFQQGETCVGPRTSKLTWPETSRMSIIRITDCAAPLVPRDQVARNRAAAGMPPLGPPQ
ncbi:MAG: TonB family protein [Gemmatimonadota bacterium]